MNRFLINYAWEICELSKAQGVDMSVAPDMFCENLATCVEGEPVHYEGADVNYAELSALWNEMDADSQADAKICFRNMWRDNRKELTEARRNNDRVAFDGIAFGYSYDPNPDEPDYVLFRGAFQCFDNAVDNGISITQARDEYIAKLEEEDNTIADARRWRLYTPEQKAMEMEWFDVHVVLYDKGLIYAHAQNNRPLFRSILCTR